jgi:hypothetical protein
MGLLTNILLFPIIAPARGITFVLNAIADQANAELYSPDKVRQELMELQLRLELGEISEIEYTEQEAALLERLNAILAAQEEEERG